MKILLLGVGLQGKAALFDLVQSPAVTTIIAADSNGADLQATVAGLDSEKIIPVEVDARNERQVGQLMTDADAVVHLLPAAFGEPMARLAVKHGCHFVDASYSLPAYGELHDEAVAKGVAILPEFGLDPGIDLVLVAQALGELDEVWELHSYGAGVPEAAAANNLLQYKIAWNFAGVLSSYIRPARLIQKGRAVDIPGNDLFDAANIHRVKVTGLGELEAYPNGDAVKYVEMLGLEEQIKEAGRYSMRWPGHSTFWHMLVNLGFLNEEPIAVAGSKVSPRHFVHNLLRPQLQYGDDERDVAVVRLDAVGLKDGQRLRLSYQVIDWRERASGLLAMQRTVGYTASIGAQMILRGDISGRGLLSPLHNVPPDLLWQELEQRGISVQRQEQELDRDSDL
jgi:lysine 6-dehydrogenase